VGGRFPSPHPSLSFSKGSLRCKFEKTREGLRESGKRDHLPPSFFPRSFSCFMSCDWVIDNVSRNNATIRYRMRKPHRALSSFRTKETRAFVFASSLLVVKPKKGFCSQASTKTQITVTARHPEYIAVKTRRNEKTQNTPKKGRRPSFPYKKGWLRPKLHVSNAIGSRTHPTREGKDTKPHHNRTPTCSITPR